MTMTETVTGLVHVRAFDDAALDLSDGKLRGRLVPYDKPTLVMDTLPNGGTDIYNEGFRNTAFDRLLRDPKGNAGRLEFKHRHDGGLGYLGPGIAMEQGDDGFYAEFQIVRTMRDNVADLLAAGHRGLSVEFRESPGGTVEEDGVRWRTDVRLTGVALCWQGAYSEAEVVAVRAEVEGDEAERLKAEQADRERQQAADADAAAAQKAQDEADARRAHQAEVLESLAEMERQQAELAAKYK